MLPRKDPHRCDSAQGLYQKYKIERMDGTVVQDHEIHFVLRIDSHGDTEHVKACHAALLEFARRTPNRRLAEDCIRLVAREAGLLVCKEIVRELERYARSADSG